MLASLAINTINHVLQRHGWAKKRLQLFTGKTAYIKIGPALAFSFVVDKQGAVQPIDHHADIDTTIDADINTVPKIFCKDKYLYRYLKVTGDHDFAAELVQIVQHTDFDLAQDFSHFIGDIPAHRISQLGNRFISWHLHGLHNITHAFSEFVTEEQPTLAKNNRMQQFVKNVQAVTTQTEQLEQKLTQITHKIML